MLPIAFAAGEMSNLSGVSIQAALLVIAAAVIGYGIGDTLLFQSILIVGVSRAYTITYTYPLLTMVVAVILLGEPFHLTTLIGTALMVLSVISLLSEKKDDPGKNGSRGLVMAFGTAITWAIGILLVALGLREMTVLQANAIRYPALSLFLLALSKPTRKWNLDRKSWLLLFCTGALGMVVGGVIFLLSVNLIGASKATPLSASSPVWASIMSSLFLKEKVTPRLLISSALVVAGTYFITV
jgi:O-acetylserine/cysteine efflux transporter